MSRLLYSRTTLRACGVVLIAAGLLGCGSGEPDSGTDAWTVQEDAADLQRTLHVGDNEQFYFGNIHDVAVDDSRRIYVADGQAHHVKILSPDGSFIDSLGTQGQGPGEFDRLSHVTLARGDSLYVLDARNGRISVFSPNHAFAYAFTARDNEAPNRILVPEGTGEFVGVFMPNPMRVAEGDAKTAVRSVWRDGSVGDTLLTAPPYQFAVRKQGRGIMFSSVPFSRSPHFALGPNNNVYYAWNDNLKVTRYALDGQKEESRRIPFESVPVTEEEIENKLEGRSRMRNLVRKNIPATKPAFAHFLVDDEGRYWFGRPTANPDSTVWWVARPDEKQVATTTLSSEVEILTVTDGQAYGRTTTEMGAPALVRYRIDTNT